MGWPKGGWEFGFTTGTAYDPFRTETNINATATTSVFYRLRKKSQLRKTRMMVTPETSPSSEKRRRSEDEPERKAVDDQGLEKERNEDMPAFVKRIKSTSGDMIPVYIEKNVDPVYVQRAAEDGLRELRFGASALVVKVFLFWLFHDSVPSITNLADFPPPATTEYLQHEQYQILLIKAWLFAEERGLPAMQNAIMRYFFDEIDEQFLSEDVLQEGLLKTRRGTPMRKALIEELIWLTENTRTVNDDGEEVEEDGTILERLKLDYVCGFDQDYNEAWVVTEKRCLKRGTADHYIVKEA